MVNGKRVLVEEVSSLVSISGSFVKFGSHVWSFCDDLVCWYHGLVGGGSHPFSFSLQVDAFIAVAISVPP